MPRTVLVTGISRGLGKAIASEFLDQGWCVPATSGVDVRDRKAVRDFIRGLDRLDAIINNAGINKDQLLAKISPEDWDRIIDVNLTGVFNVCREGIKLMRKSGGHIVNISSRAGVKGSAGQCHYAASKAGVIGFSKTLAKEVCRWNIKVNVILPGYMKTGMLKQEFIQRAENENLLGKTNDPADIAKFIYGLVQTDFVSAQVFNLDSRIC